MSYFYSFTSSPPTGITINSATGLITIANTTAAFTGNLSVQVTDGVTTIVKTIPLTLTTPATTPLISRLYESIVICGGMARIAFEQINIGRAITGGIFQSSFGNLSQNVSTASSGDLIVTSTYEPAGGGGGS